jgi:hypothetical protein
VKHFVLGFWCVLLFVFCTINKYEITKLKDDQWNDHMRIACLELNHEYPQFIPQLIYKQDAEWPNQCVDKYDHEWFAWGKKEK